MLVGRIHRRHELPHDPNDPLNKQNVKDRFDGKNDPVAQKILERLKQQEKDEERERKQVTVCFLRLSGRRRKSQAATSDRTMIQIKLYILLFVESICA